MSSYKVSGNDLSSVADAIRTKGGTSSGLSFPDGFVSAIEDIPTGGGSTLITKSISANGTYNASSDNADGYSSVSVNVPSLLVTGTFKGTTSGVLTVPVSYSGNGYPVALAIYPKDGAYNSESEMYSLVQRYAINFYAMSKCLPDVSPDYTSGSGISNSSAALVQYKNSTSSATDYTSSHSTNSILYGIGDAQESRYNPVRFNSSTSMKVYIANTSYGFAKDIEYMYQIVYSE